MPKSKTTTEVAASAAWHARIAQQLAAPVIPEDLPQETRQEIENQKERHQLFAKSLNRLAAAGAQ